MLARLRHSRKSDLPLHRAIISDIILWIFLVLGALVAVYWFAIRMPEQDGQTILLKFRDANQITRGSAVTMLGTDVGYVKSIHIHQDHVDVFVQTFSKSLSIPSGATFTVVFNGLAGSKSIDIEVPRVPLPEMEGHPIYTVAEPIRLKTILDYIVDMTQGLTEGAEIIADFFGKKKPVEELQFNIHQAHQWTLDSLAYAEQITRDMRSFRQDLDQGVNSGARVLTNLSHRAKLMAARSKPERIRPEVVSALQTLHSIRNAVVADDPRQSPFALRIQRWNDGAMKVKLWTEQTNQKVQAFPLAHILDRIECGEDSFISFLDQIQAFFECNDKQKLQEFRQNIQAFNRQVIAIGLKMGAAVPANKPYTPCCPPLSQPKRTPMHPVRPSTSDAAPAFPVVDRSGTIQRHPNAWWDRHPSAKKEVASSPPDNQYIRPGQKDEKDTEQSFFIPLLQGMSGFVGIIWDNLIAFFTS